MTNIENRGVTSWLRKGVVAATALVAAVCVAAPTAFGAIIQDPLGAIGQGPVKVKFSDFETAVSQKGDVLSGIFNVTNIVSDDGLNTLLWSSGEGNAQLNGYFTGLTVVGFSSPTSAQFSGGQLVLYLAPAGSFDATQNPNTISPTTQLCGGACGTPWLTADFVPGVLDPNTTVTLASSTTGSVPPTGHGTGYLSVAMVDGMTGTANNSFDTNAYTFSANPNADLRLESDFTICAGNNQPASCKTGWQVVSEDPVRATIPEPGTVALIGLGLLGLSLTRRKTRA